MAAGPAPPTLGVNEKVTATFRLAVTRSTAAIENEMFETASPTTPDGTEFEVAVSALVCTVTLPPAVGVLRKVKPESVTVTLVLALRVAPAVVKTMELVPGTPTTREAPPDTAPVGVELVAKKLLG